MDCASEPMGFHYEGNCIRPPSEAYSILIQATLGCSHNKCAFCGTYNDKRFNIKDRAILEQDLAFAQKHCRRQNRVFIMDGDSMIMPMRHWEWLLGEIQKKASLGGACGDLCKRQSHSFKKRRGIKSPQGIGHGDRVLRR